MAGLVLMDSDERGNPAALREYLAHAVARRLGRDHRHVHAGRQIVTEETKRTMRRLLTEIQDGTFARTWIDETERGQPNFRSARQRETEHPIEDVGRALRRMMPFVQPKEVQPGAGGA